MWGAPRIHGELLKLGIAVAQSTVATYLSRSRKPPSQTWRTFLTNHLARTAAIDFFTVPTAAFRVLFVFVVLAHKPRRMLHSGVTEHPTEEWTMQQMRASGAQTLAKDAKTRRNRKKQGIRFFALLPLRKSVLRGKCRGITQPRICPDWDTLTVRIAVPLVRENHRPDAPTIACRPLSHVWSGCR